MLLIDSFLYFSPSFIPETVNTTQDFNTLELNLVLYINATEYFNDIDNWTKTVLETTTYPFKNTPTIPTPDIDISIQIIAIKQSTTELSQTNISKSNCPNFYGISTLLMPLILLLCNTIGVI